jgi:hypothetical protein
MFIIDCINVIWFSITSYFLSQNIKMAFLFT